MDPKDMTSFTVKADQADVRQDVLVRPDARTFDRPPSMRQKATRKQRLSGAIVEYEVAIAGAAEQRSNRL